MNILYLYFYYQAYLFTSKILQKRFDALLLQFCILLIFLEIKLRIYQILMFFYKTRFGDFVDAHSTVRLCRNHSSHNGHEIRIIQ